MEKKKVNPRDDIDAIAEITRRQVSVAALQALIHPQVQNVKRADAVEGFVHGVMVGAIGAALAQFNGNCDAEMRAAMMQAFPHYFNQALEIMGRPTLGEIN